MAIANRIIVVGPHGSKPIIKLEPNEAQIFVFDFREWMAERYVAGTSATIPAVTTAFNPAGSAPTISGLTYTAYSVRMKITAGASVYSGELTFDATLNSGGATEEIKSVAATVQVVDTA